MKTTVLPGRPSNAPAPSPHTESPQRLACRWHVGAGEHETSLDRGSLTIARGDGEPSADRVFVHDEFVSEATARLDIDTSGRAFVSLCPQVTNPVFLNGKQVVEKVEVPSRGAILKVGRTHVVVSPEPNVVFGIVCRSGAMRAALFDLMKIAGASKLPILFEGETGTGKSSVARAVSEAIGLSFSQVIPAELPSTMLASALYGHKRGAFTDAREDREGTIETAGEGMLLVDEIGDLARQDQVRLLRLVRERKYNRVGDDTVRSVRCRFVFATNLDLDTEVAAGRFRYDLLQRIKGFRVTLPPLRARPDDIPYLLQHALRKTDLPVPADAFEDNVRRALQERSWPGNVGEFEYFVEYARALGSFSEALGVLDHRGASSSSTPSLPNLSPQSLGEVRPWKDLSSELRRFYFASLVSLAESHGTPALCAKLDVTEDSFKRMLRRAKGEDL